jgi:hypothetical protein
MKAFPGNRFEGMELRDYFAAQAYKFADAMMKARKAREKKDE